MDTDPSGWEKPRRPICNMNFNDFARTMKAQPRDKKGAKKHIFDDEEIMHAAKTVPELEPANIKI